MIYRVIQLLWLKWRNFKKPNFVFGCCNTGNSLYSQQKWWKWAAANYKNANVQYRNGFFYESFFFKVCRQKKTVITNHLDDEGIFLEFWVIFCLFQLVLVWSFEPSYEGFGVWDFRRLFLFGSRTSRDVGY